MKCYYHPQVDAVAVCKHCHKGLCTECALDVGGGMACKTSPDNCPAEVKFYNQTLARSKRSYLTGRRNYGQWALLIAVPGIVFTLYGLSSASGDMRLVGAALLPVGIILLLLALFFYLGRRNYPAG